MALGSLHPFAVAFFLLDFRKTQKDKASEQQQQQTIQHAWQGRMADGRKDGSRRRTQDIGQDIGLFCAVRCVVCGVKSVFRACKNQLIIKQERNLGV